MPTLARKLRLTDYFTLAFGTMVGVGWLVLMDDWLARGGPLGAALGFALGGVLLLPAGHVSRPGGHRLADSAREGAHPPPVFSPVGSLLYRLEVALCLLISFPF